MAGERRIRILGMLVAGTTPGLETNRLCQVCAEVTGVSGAGIMVISGDLPRGSICTTDDVSALIEHLQFELGEGPCVDAVEVVVSDLAATLGAEQVSFLIAELSGDTLVRFVRPVPGRRRDPAASEALETVAIAGTP